MSTSKAVTFYVPDQNRSSPSTLEQRPLWAGKQPPHRDSAASPMKHISPGEPHPINEKGTSYPDGIKIHVAQTRPESQKSARPSSRNGSSRPNKLETEIEVHAETGQVRTDSVIASSSPKPTSAMRSSPTIKATVVAEKLRQQTNSINHDYIRSIKYEVAKLHEHLLKVEEEIKNSNKGRQTLEMAIQDIRRSISVNQQSLSTQQKKTRCNNEVYYI